MSGKIYPLDTEKKFPRRKSSTFPFSVFAAILAIVAAALFAIETDEMRTGFMITRGVSFYLQVSWLFGENAWEKRD